VRIAAGTQGALPQRERCVQRGKKIEENLQADRAPRSKSAGAELTGTMRFEKGKGASAGFGWWLR